MEVSSDGLAIKKHYESCVLTAYPDPASPLGTALVKAGLYSNVVYRGAQIPPSLMHLSGAPWTIGWGHTGPEVVPGLKWTQEQADTQLALDAKKFSGYVNQYVNQYAVVCLAQHQFDALVSFCYNLGPGNLQSSTLLKKVNAQDFPGAALEFLKWNKAQGKVMLGLTRRRTAEKALFEGKTVTEAIALGDAVV